VIDLETYKDVSGSKVYAAGVYIPQLDLTKIFYINKNLDSDKVILDLVNFLMDSKFAKYNFYCHNLGGFDSVYLINTIIRYNELNPDSIFRTDIIARNIKTNI